MSDVAIRVEGVSKRYLIGTGRPRYGRLSESLWNGITAPFRRLRGDSEERARGGHIWALKDVSLEVRRGEVVGVIGRNGAGKTTLLKVLSRITEPSEGYAEIRGRVGSLLEVGTGFHPELTGRENIYLNGAILGMRRAEIDRKFDEIVTFAEVERFIDTPVKRFSSGMQVRLAFAVAAHLDPEILLVDEVLGVGDFDFQQKSLGRMERIAEGGRTVLFVSHQLNQVRRLCNRAVWIDAGRLNAVGTAAEVVNAYESDSTDLTDLTRETGDHSATTLSRGRFLSWRVDEGGSGASQIDSMGPVAVSFRLRLDESLGGAHHGVALFDFEGQLVWATANRFDLPSGVCDVTHNFPFLPLKPGAYRWQVSLYDQQGLIDLWDCTPQLIIDTPLMGHPRDEWSGVLNLPCNTGVEPVAEENGQIQNEETRGARS
jgi:lipopolysaccharide transport system ATP-binding protein